MFIIIVPRLGTLFTAFYLTSASFAVSVSPSRSYLQK
jgi:hypothetical protein